VQQALLRGEKGFVDALLHVQSDAKGNCAWGSNKFCFRNMSLDIAADVRQQLLSDGRGIVEAIVGVLAGDEAAAWASACRALANFSLASLHPLNPCSCSRSRCSLQPSSLVSRTKTLNNSWGDNMRLLNRLVYQEASLSHITLCTLDFLKKDCGRMAVLLRCSRGFSTEAKNEVFHSACGALVLKWVKTTKRSDFA
jgi:hypothetical protein